jgi:ATP-dependent protease ClpP protease subunit
MITTIHVYSAITSSTLTFVKSELEAAKGKDVLIRINSPGGSVFDGLTIYQLLKSHSRKVSVCVDGVAASIASIIALAGSERHISKGGMMMIHSASLATRGNASQLQKDAATLAKIDSQLVDIYHAATKQPRKAIIDMMAAETWLTAAECVKLGFCHKTVEGVRAAAQWNSAAFPQMPQAALQAAGIVRPSVREVSAELDRLKSENAAMRLRLAEATKAKPAEPKSATPLADKMAELSGTARTAFYSANAHALKVERARAACPGAIIPD